MSGFKTSGWTLASLAALVPAVLGSGALAQDYPPPPAPPPGYQGAPGYGGPNDGDRAPPGEYDAQPPQGYDGSRPPPPPPGYQPDPRYAPQPDEDRRYEAYAEDWSQRYCVKAQNNAGAGAVIGGLFGALLGSGIAGRHDRGAGAVLGGVAGAAGGAAIGSTSRDATSPGCPPGFVVRRDAPAFYYPAGPYYYAAPVWYRPWIFYDGRWSYRPYPYHVWYYERGYGGPYGGRRHYRRY